MINCGGVNAKQPKSHDWVKNSTIKAMSSVFNQVCLFSFFFFFKNMVIAKVLFRKRFIGFYGPKDFLDSQR